MIINSTQEQAQKPKRMYGFVPYRLELKNFPKYDNFPYNLAFISYANIDGVDKSGTAIYYPDFSTFKESDSEHSMNYYNQYNRDWRVEVVYDLAKKSWEGTKYFKDEWQGQGGGPEWNMGMAHMTMAGLVKGETCLFTII